MTPLTSNPTITVLVDKNNKVLKVATNVAAEMNVVVTCGEAFFNDRAVSAPFVFVPAPTNSENN